LFLAQPARIASLAFGVQHLTGVIVVGAAYHKSHLQVRHWLNITREVTHLRQIQELG
jgi:hypothetical protein